MPQVQAAKAVDFSGREKLTFVAIVLPLLGAIGGIMRVSGISEETTLAIVLPLLLGAFLVSRYATYRLEARDVALQVHREQWAKRSERLERRRQELVARQQEELREIRIRQQAEQDRLLAERASGKQLKQMMERHRREYEELLRRQIA